MLVLLLRAAAHCCTCTMRNRKRSEVRGGQGAVGKPEAADGNYFRYEVSMEENKSMKVVFYIKS